MYFISTSIVDNSQMIVRRNGDTTMWIPMDKGNVDYRAYLEWLDEGNTPDTWQPGEQ